MSKENAEIFMLCESNILSSGEVEFYVDVYLSRVRVEEDLVKQVRQRVDENNASVVYDTGEEAVLEDGDGNKYKFWIETKVPVE